MKMQYLESLQAFVTTEIRIWDPSQPPSVYHYQKFYQKKYNNVLGYVTIIGLTGNAFIKSFSSRSLTVKKQEEGLWTPSLKF